MGPPNQVLCVSCSTLSQLEPHPSLSYFVMLGWDSTNPISASLAALVRLCQQGALEGAVKPGGRRDSSCLPPIFGLLSLLWASCSRHWLFWFFTWQGPFMQHLQ